MRVAYLRDRLKGAVGAFRRYMSLSEFKTIFWWEWTHRLLARSIGAVFFFPFLYFLMRGGLGSALKRRLWVLFALGGLQGAVGWWMVKSGLTARVSVSQYRLAIHFLLALLIFSAIVWTMIPRGPLGRIQMSNLRVYPGAEHPHEAQSPEVVDIASLNRKNTRAA